MSVSPLANPSPRLNTSFLSALISILIAFIFGPPAVSRLLGLTFPASPWRDTFAAFFLSITLEALPFILLGTLLTALMEVFLSQDILPRLTARLGVWGIPASAIFSPLFPICDCAVVMVVRGLLRKRLPLPHAVTYM
ncbi:MAG: permease, partial [Deltaproteobacteria bacterium]|nr:permease [Deltaproteobacteria bacterium]